MTLQTEFGLIPRIRLMIPNNLRLRIDHDYGDRKASSCTLTAYSDKLV